jgi:hypothetical protein
VLTLINKTMTVLTVRALQLLLPLGCCGPADL